MKEPAFARVSPRNMWLLLLSSLRYSFGRASYYPSVACELILRYRNSLTPEQVAQIVRESKAELTRWRNTDGKPIGGFDDIERSYLRMIRELEAKP